MCIDKVKKILDAASTIILDVEGTTTSIKFVKSELFPYAEQNVDGYVRENWTNNKMTEIRNFLLNDQSKLQGFEGFTALPLIIPCEESQMEEFKCRVISHLKWQQKNDFKTSALKTLQGYIWEKGYLDGTIKGHIYDDVPAILEYWKKLGKKIFIYSSGSVGAQKLLFHSSVFGDLDKFIDGNFDTTIGSKIECESYLKIAKEINEKPENIIFFTDRPKEVVAAKKSGMHVVRLVREDDNPYLEQEKEYLGVEDAALESFLLLKS